MKKERDTARVLDETAQSLFKQAEILRWQAQDLVAESRRLLRAAERQRADKGHKSVNTA